MIARSNRNRLRANGSNPTRRAFTPPVVIWSRWVATISLALLVTATPAAAYDLNAAATAFDSNKAKDPAALVLKGWSGNDSSVKEYSIERIMDRAAWSAVWARHAPGVEAPDVNFSTAMIIAIFTGSVSTSVIPEINLYSVTEDEKIDVTTMNYVNDVVSEQRKNLYVIVVLKRSIKALHVFSRSYSLNKQTRENSILLKKFAFILSPCSHK